MTVRSLSILAAATLLGAACGGDNSPGAGTAARAPVEDTRPGVYRPEAAMTPEELASQRLSGAWRRVVQLDSVPGTDTVANPERWEQISAERVNQSPAFLPLSGDVAGPSVLRVQVLLDRALFSPGMIDGRWGDNTEKAVYWLQRREGIPATGRVDRPTFDRLVRLASAPNQLVRPHRLSAQDVAGPFVETPEDIYEQAELECLCYESLSEKLGEMFHVTPELLGQMNPGVDLNTVPAGTTIQVPAVRTDNAAGSTPVARIAVSDQGGYVHALDANGRIVYHFPSTLGSTYNPSPTGDFRVTNVAFDPTWHYQPEIIEDAEPGPDAMIPAGPNVAVGKVWMELNKEHYGIHGTSAPQTIGYTTSSGCVRLTNWDAVFLARQVDERLPVPVEFRDT